MGLGGVVERLNSEGGGIAVLEDSARPWKFFVGVEIPAENDHQIDELTNIALGGYFVTGSALDPVLDQLQ
jgi:hypothetical protein